VTAAQAGTINEKDCGRIFYEQNRSYENSLLGLLPLLSPEQFEGLRRDHR
jgi:hypothetical protein